MLRSPMPPPLSPCSKDATGVAAAAAAAEAAAATGEEGEGAAIASRRPWRIGVGVAAYEPPGSAPYCS